jgi:nicotinamidase-related amidase
MADFSLESSETALVLIEYQNDFTTEGGKLYGATKECMDSTGMLSTSKKMMDAARAAGLTIIHVPICFEPVSVSMKTCVA